MERFSSLVTESRPWPVIGWTIFFTSDKNRPTRDEIYFIDFWRENLSMYRISSNYQTRQVCRNLETECQESWPLVNHNPVSICLNCLYALILSRIYRLDQLRLPYKLINSSR